MDKWGFKTIKPLIAAWWWLLDHGKIGGGRNWECHVSVRPRPGNAPASWKVTDPQGKDWFGEFEKFHVTFQDVNWSDQNYVPNASRYVWFMCSKAPHPVPQSSMWELSSYGQGITGGLYDLACIKASAFVVCMKGNFVSPTSDQKPV
jgi:hypothetical protein